MKRILALLMVLLLGACASAVSPSTPRQAQPSGRIPFGSSGNPKALNPVLGWQPGSSTANRYDLEINPGALTLTAGPDTFPGAPMIVYTCKGNFEATVKLVINPQKKFQGAGIVVKPPQARSTDPYSFPSDWISLYRYLADQQFINGDFYADPIIYLKIERQGTIFNTAYSSNGNKWFVLSKDRVSTLPDEVDIFLYAYSTQNDQGVVAQFYDFTVNPK